MSAYRWVADEIITTTGTSAYTLTVPTTNQPILRAVAEAGSSTGGKLVYYTYDGTAPTQNVGKRMIVSSVGIPGTEVEMFGGQLDSVKFAASAAGPLIHVDYYV